MHGGGLNRRHEPIIIGGQERERMCVRIYNFDPSLAPAGKTVMKVYFVSDLEYWKKLKQAPERYDLQEGQ